MIGKASRPNLDSDSKWFVKLDATHGYFQIPLTEESSKLTTFLLPSGKYRYLCAPMGCSASSDEWCRRSDIAIAGVPSTQKLVDDILISAPTKEIALQRLCMTLEGCRKARVTLSMKKLKLGQEVKFGGYIINSEGVKPNPDNIDGISKFPTPTDVSELRSFFGLVNTFDIFKFIVSHNVV